MGAVAEHGEDRGAGATAARRAVAKPARRGHLTVTRPRWAFVYPERGCGPSRGSPRPLAGFLLRRALLLNLVLNVPAPKSRTPEAKTFREARIGRCRRDPGGGCRVFIGGDWWQGGPCRLFPPSLEGDLEDVGAAGGGGQQRGVPRGRPGRTPSGRA